MIADQRFRPDIQGLRAIAVLIVLVFHVWPAALPGGYVGVDVFFVISGFLITGLLVREFEREGSISLGRFYARRIRRLLPAATLVLVVVAISSWFWLPPSMWADLAKEVLASGLYIENLLLVSKSVDYLALQEAASPVQHYWSLSVEEQFYILWPLLMIAAGASAKRMAWRTRTVFAWILSATTAVSFAHGLYGSYVDPAPSYFLTTTRIWELGIGGLLAITVADRQPSSGISRLFGWVGLGAIAASAWFYTTGIPFPGYEALLPTLGTASLIFARSQPERQLGKLLGSRPFQYFGDISYSLYLWHWPIVVLYPYVTGREISRVQDGLTVMVVSTIAAHFSKYSVEDILRHTSPAHGGARHQNRSAYVMGGVCILAVAAAAAVPYRAAPQVDPVAGISTAVLDAAHPGAEAFLRGAQVPRVDAWLPAPGMAKLDRGSPYGGNGRENCIGSTTSDALAFCHYGSEDSKVHVVVVGDSHAVHWLPAFEVLGEQKGWKITGLTKSSCAVSDVTVRFGRGSTSRDYEECTRWNRRMLDWVKAAKPDLVIVSMSPNHQLKPGIFDPQRVIAEGTVRELDELLAAGLDVAMIKHTPWRLEDPPSCLSRPNASVDACSGTREQVILDGPLVLASRIDRRLRLLDFDDAFCRGSECPVVIGNVVVNRDKNHLTATFARSLAPALHERIRQSSPTLN